MNDKYILNRVIEIIIINEFNNNNAAFAKVVKLSRQLIGQIRNNNQILGISGFIEMLNKLNKTISFNDLIEIIKT